MPNKQTNQPTRGSRRSPRTVNRPESPPVPSVPSVPSPVSSSESSEPPESSGSTPSPGGSTTRSPSPAPSVPDNVASSASTCHRRKTSISDLDPKDMAALGKTMGDISVVISQAKISRPDFAELEELRELEQLVEKYQKAADWVKAQDHDKFTIVKAVPISKTTIPILESIGAEFPAKNLKLVDNDMMTEEWLTSKNVLPKGDLSKLKKWDKTPLTRTLKRLDATVCDKVEASARMAIDQWVLELGGFCEERGSILQIFPESIISASSDAPAVISHKRVRIRLTGLTDYLVWKVFPSERKELEKNRYGINTFQTYQQIQTATFETHHKRHGAHLLFIEAKNVHEKLRSHLAQVVAQIIAAICITRSHEMTSGLEISGMPFILTNGKQWIFGVVSSGPEKTKCVHTAELEFSGKETMLLTVLYIWATQSVIDLLEILKA